MRISDWSSDVCSSDLRKGASLWCRPRGSPREAPVAARQRAGADGACSTAGGGLWLSVFRRTSALRDVFVAALSAFRRRGAGAGGGAHRRCGRACMADPSRRRRNRGQRLDPDRKSVVWGKSVSVLLDLGGRRTIEKKNTTHISRHEQYKR